MEPTLISTFTQDWKPYLQYGDQSWKRLSDPVRRRDIGLFLVTEMIKHDPATQTVRAATFACSGNTLPLALLTNLGARRHRSSPVTFSRSGSIRLWRVDSLPSTR